jgi:hypothetical protein
VVEEVVVEVEVGDLLLLFLIQVYHLVMVEQEQL